MPKVQVQNDPERAAQAELYDELRIGCRAERMAKTIDRLLETAPVEPGQNPAIICAVLLSGNEGFVAGALARYGNGGLKLMLMGTEVGTELFFDYASVVALGVKREVSTSSLIRG
jgi:hypothetical protein